MTLHDLSGLLEGMYDSECDVPLSRGRRAARGARRERHVAERRLEQRAGSGQPGHGDKVGQGEQDTMGDVMMPGAGVSGSPPAGVRL